MWFPLIVGATVLAALLGDNPVRASHGRALVVDSARLATPAVPRRGRLVVTVRLINRGGKAVRGRVTVRLRRAKGTRRRIVLRRAIKRVQADGSARFTIARTLPRRVKRGRHRVTVCVRSRGTARCRWVRRRLKVGRAIAPGAAPDVQTPLAPAPVTKPKGQAFQRIDGFGSSERGFADPHLWDLDTAPATSPAQRDEVLDTLYARLGLTRVRAVQPDTAAGPPPVGIEAANDNGDPSVLDASKFTFGGRRLDDHAVLLRQIKARGSIATWTSPLNRDRWMGARPGTADVAEYAEWIFAQVQRFKQQGAPLDYISVANEPSFKQNPMSGAFIHDVIAALAPRLRDAGLLVPFIVPDDIRSSDAVSAVQPVLADPATRQYVGAIATHLYDEPVSALGRLRDVARQYGLPLWMTEFSLGAMSSIPSSPKLRNRPVDWALLMNDLLGKYDVGAIDYLWGFIGQGDSDRFSLVRLNQTDGTYRGFAPTKVYYYFGQYSRFVRPGAIRVAADSSASGVRVTAYLRGKEVTVVAVNPTDQPVATTITSRDLEGASRLQRTETTPTQNWATPGAATVDGTQVSVTVPAAGVTTLSGATG